MFACNLTAKKYEKQECVRSASKLDNAFQNPNFFPGCPAVKWSVKHKKVTHI